MTPRMSGQINSLKPRKRKSGSEASAARRRCTNGPKTQSAAEGSRVDGGQRRPPTSPEGPSRIACECHPATGTGRCSASPELEGRDGKENQLGTGPEAGRCRGNRTPGKPEAEDMDYEDTSKAIFPDDDSNQILPVEQFFGNMDAVQDFPQRSPATSASVQREHRRRHYYAREDSDEDEDEARGSTGATS